MRGISIRCTVVACLLGTGPAAARAADPAADVLADPDEHRVAVHGLVHVEYEDEGGEQGGRERVFELEHVFLRAEARPLAALEIVAELLSEEGAAPAFLQAHATYRVRPWLEVRAGKFLVPFGRQDGSYYCSHRWFNHLPVSHTTLLPDRWSEVGLSLGGTVPIRRAGVRWDLVVGNGRGPAGEEQLGDNNTDKLIGGRLVLALEPVVLGGSFATWKHDDAGRHRTTMAGAHAALTLGGLTLRGEYVASLLGFEGGTSLGSGFYAEAGYRVRLRRLRGHLLPAVRYQAHSAAAPHAATPSQVLDVALRVGVREHLLVTAEWGLRPDEGLSDASSHALRIGVVAFF